MAYGNYRNNFDDYSNNITNFYGYGYNDYGDDDEDEQLYIKLQPFSIFFLLFYIVLIVTQFICMLWHRLIPDPSKFRHRIPTVKLKIPGKAFLKSDFQLHSSYSF